MSNQSNESLGSLFDVEIFKRALSSMSREEQENFKRMGQHMYGKVNFENSKIIDNQLPPSEDTTAYINTILRSGALPKDLNQAEYRVMETEYGPNWWKEKYDFNEDDLPRERESPRL